MASEARAEASPAPYEIGRPALQLAGSIIMSLPLGPGRNKFGPAVVRVRTAKSAVAGDHLLHAHFVGWQTAVVRKEIALTSARAPRHLSGLADAKVEQHWHRYGQMSIDNAAMRALPSASSAAVLMSTPIRRIRSRCCACAASGHTAAAPPSSLMNCLRFTRSPRRHERAASAAPRCRAPWRS